MTLLEQPFHYKLRTISEVRASLNSFNSTLIENSTIEELQEKIGEIISTYSSKQYSLNPGGVILRGRINCDSKLFKTIKQIWYPPNHKIKKIGRCNNIGQSLFYCSIDPETILRELKPSKGDWLTILECETPNHAMSLLMPIGIDALKNLNPELNNIFKNHFNNSFATTEEGKEKNRLLNDFLANLFQKAGEAYYKATVAISNILLSDPRVNGIIYPSIASHLDGLNFVFRPNYADENIFPYHAVVYEVVDKSESTYFIKRLYNSEILSGQYSLTWNSVPPNNEPPAEYRI